MFAKALPPYLTLSDHTLSCIPLQSVTRECVTRNVTLCHEEPQQTCRDVTRDACHETLGRECRQRLEEECDTRYREEQTSQAERQCDQDCQYR